MDVFAAVFVFILVNGALSTLVAYVAKLRNRSATAFFWLSFVASFLVGILVLIALPTENQRVEEQRLPCPHCDEPVSRKAKICPHCRLEVGVHFQKIKAKEGEDLAKKKKQIEAEEFTASRRAHFEAAARKELTSRLLRHPIIWIVAGVMAIGLISAISLLVIEQRRDARLLATDCGVKQETITMTFDMVMKVGFSLPEECGENLAVAIERGLVQKSEAVGKIKLELFLDDKPVTTWPVSQSLRKAEYKVEVPSSLFWEYSHARDIIAESVRVVLTYENALGDTEPASLTQAIPRTQPVVRLINEKLTQSSSSGTNFFVVLFSYATYQVADYIELDWPGEDQDSRWDSPGQTKESLQGWMGDSYYSTSNSANVVIDVIQDGKVVQRLKVDSN